MKEKVKEVKVALEVPVLNKKKTKNQLGEENKDYRYFGYDKTKVDFARKILSKYKYNNHIEFVDVCFFYDTVKKKILTTDPELVASKNSKLVVIDYLHINSGTFQNFLDENKGKKLFFYLEPTVGSIFWTDHHKQIIIKVYIS